MRKTRYRVQSIVNKEQNSPRVRGGFSLIEMLVVIFVFSVLGVVSTQILALSLRGTKKSESISEVRANLEYAASNMERLLRNATSIEDCSTGTKLEYKDENGVPAYFECKTLGSDICIASGSASLGEVKITSSKVKMACSGAFSCDIPTDTPHVAYITLRGEDAELGVGIEGSSVTVRTQIQLRNY